MYFGQVCITSWKAGLGRSLKSVGCACEVAQRKIDIQVREGGETSLVLQLMRHLGNARVCGKQC